MKQLIQSLIVDQNANRICDQRVTDKALIQQVWPGRFERIRQDTKRLATLQFK